MKHCISVIAAATVFSVMSFTSQSWADFWVCNQSSVRASVAIGYKHMDYGWVSEGWWNVAPDDCISILKGNLPNRYYYVYANGRNTVWEASEGQKGGFFCTTSKKFTFRNDDFQSGTNIDCEASNQTTRHFIEVDTGDARNFRFNLR